MERRGLDLIKPICCFIFRYWPAVSEGEGGDPMVVGDFTITTQSATRTGKYVFSLLQLTFTQDGQDTTRDVGHFWYDSWPDHGAPAETTSVTDMLQAVKEYTPSAPEHPWIVHCSAGIGRTGAFLGIDIGMQLLATQGKVSVKKVIKNLRKDRGGTVQTAVQAAFIQRALETFAEALNEPELATFEVETPLGLKFNGPADRGYVVSFIKDESNAEASGITPGMRIHSIDGTRVAGLQKADVMGLLQSSTGRVILIMAPPTSTVLPLYVDTPHGMEYDGSEEEGYVVLAVDAGSHADKAGIRPNMRILRVNQTSVDGVDKAKVDAEIGAGGGTAMLTVEVALVIAEARDGDDNDSDAESDYDNEDATSYHSVTAVSLGTTEAEAVVDAGPSWLHSNLDDKTAAALLREAGLHNGQFLVREVNGEQNQNGHEEYKLYVASQAQILTARPFVSKWLASKIWI